MTCALYGEKWQRRAAETAISRRLGPFCLRAHSCNNSRRCDESRWSRRPTLTTHSAQQIEDVPIPQIVEETTKVLTPLQYESLNRSSTRHPQVVKKIVQVSQTHAVSCERARCEDCLKTGSSKEPLNQLRTNTSSKSHAQFERGQAQPDHPGGESIK